MIERRKKIWIPCARREWEMVQVQDGRVRVPVLRSYHSICSERNVSELQLELASDSVPFFRLQLPICVGRQCYGVDTRQCICRQSHFSGVSI